MTWKNTVTTERVLGASIAAYRDGRAYVMPWGEELDPREPATDDLARTVGIE